MPPLQPARLARRFFVVAGVNTLIALSLTSAGPHTFVENLVYSQLIGLFIWAGIDGGRFLLHESGWSSARAMAALVVVAVLCGYLGGSLLAGLLLGHAALESLLQEPAKTARLLLMSLAAGGVGAYVFTSRALLARARLAHEEALRQASEARLKLLETQLEPHMLFNTLANLRALIGIDPARAQTMLDHLNRYLRATLSGSRASTHPLAAEFARLDDYLELMAIRMGPRLGFTLDLPEPLREVPVPPLLLQPLVENAIRHGLEPCIEGGQITVRARHVDDMLVLEVADTGVGLAPAAPATNNAATNNAVTSTAGGFGLAQVRERLTTAYGPGATLELRANKDRGTLAILRFPLKPCTPP